MSYTKSQIDGFAQRMRELPAIEAPPLISKMEAVKVLKPEILSMQKKGYTLEQISSELTKIGMDIKSPTLKAYLQKTNVKKKLTKSEKK